MGKSYHQRKNKIIKLFKNNKVDEAYGKLIELINKNPGDYELHYIAGMIHGSQYRYVDALNCFEKALQISPNHAKSYFEIGIIHTILCRYQEALPAFQKAKKLERNLTTANYYIREIKKVAKLRDTTLSVCLIVKNEEKHLPICLKSIQAVADEIVVIDTGSEDRSVEISESFGAKIFRYKWNNDFAAAKNFAKKQATGDWILQIDADEELFPEDQNKVREFIQQSRCDGAFVAFQNSTSSMFGENQPVVHYLIRIFRNHEDIYYVGPIHETLKMSGEAVPTDIKILHHGYNFAEEDLKRKRKRNAEILYESLQADPDNITTLFYLSMMHIGNQEFDLSEGFARRVLEKLNADDLKNQHFYLMTLKNLALINIEKQTYETARAYCQQAIKINNNYLEPVYFLGLSYFREGDYQKSKQYFESFLNKYKETNQTPVFNLFAHSADAYLFQNYHWLGKIYRKEKNYPKAQKMMLSAVKVNPTFWIGYADLGYLNMEFGDMEKAAEHLEHAIKLAKNNPEVNKSNKLIWSDFLNALKSHRVIVKRIKKDEEVEFV